VTPLQNKSIISPNGDHGTFINKFSRIVHMSSYRTDASQEQLEEALRGSIEKWWFSMRSGWPSPITYQF